MNDFTRHDLQKDLQVRLDQATIKLLQRLATKQDMQFIGEAIRERLTFCIQDELHGQQQQLSREFSHRVDQIEGRLQALEIQSANTTEELHMLQKLLQQLDVAASGILAQGATKTTPPVENEILPEESNEKIA